MTRLSLANNHIPASSPPKAGVSYHAGPRAEYIYLVPWYLRLCNHGVEVHVLHRVCQ